MSSTYLLPLHLLPPSPSPYLYTSPSPSQSPSPSPSPSLTPPLSPSLPHSLPPFTPLLPPPPLTSYPPSTTPRGAPPLSRRTSSVVGTYPTHHPLYLVLYRYRFLHWESLKGYVNIISRGCYLEIQRDLIHLNLPEGYSNGRRRKLGRGLVPPLHPVP